MKWDAESIRLSLFLATPGRTEFPSLISLITGRDPQELVERPKIMKHEVAQGDPGHYFLTQEPNRIVLVLGMPGPSVPGDNSSLVTVGGYEVAKQALYEPARTLLTQPLGAITRIRGLPDTTLPRD